MRGPEPPVRHPWRPWPPFPLKTTGFAARLWLAEGSPLILMTNPEQLLPMACDTNILVTFLTECSLFIFDRQRRSMMNYSIACRFTAGYTGYHQFPCMCNMFAASAAAAVHWVVLGLGAASTDGRCTMVG